MAVIHAAKPKPSPKAAKQPEARPKSAPPPRPAAAARTPIFLGGPVKGGGQPLPPTVQAPIENSLQVNLDAVRVHTDAGAQQAAANVSARAFTYGKDIFLGRGERPTDLRLMAHEAAHVVQQQRAPAVQKWSGSGSDSFEHEAHQASIAVASGQTFTVQERTSKARVQRLGISDALDYFADKAYNIPGYRMFTILLGVNPINMSRVERSAANILRAIVEFLPGGHLITEALDKYGVFDKVGTWIEQQLSSLGITGSAIKQAVSDFLDSLSWRDIFHLGSLWDRAKRIFTDPIDRIITFAKNLFNKILQFIKDAVLRPLAELASQTRAWDLLCAVLGKNPITGDPVPRTADTLIGGFMKLIGQEEIWQNIKKANAISRAFTWFQNALSGLVSLVKQLPSMFLDALRSLELSDIILLPRAFVKVGKVFLSFAGQFISWAGNTIWNLLEIIFAVLAPAVIPYLKKAAGAFRTILKNPIGFIGNLVKAGIQGFRQFASNFLTHLKKSLIDWLTGTLAGAGVYIPQGFTAMEIIKFVLSVLGLTWQNIRGKLVAKIGETTVKAMETGFDIVKTLVTEGPAAAWDKILEAITNLKEMVMEGIMSFVKDRIVQAAITKLVTSLNPAGAFIQAIIAIYNTIMFFIERLKQIAQVAAAFIDSIAAIANGVIAAAANKVENTMGGLLTLVISFLARLVGLGKVSDAIKNILDKVRTPIDKALDKVIDWIINMARKLGRFVAQAGLPQDPNQRLEMGLDAATSAVDRMKDSAVTGALINPLLGAIKIRYGFKTLQPVDVNGDWWIEGQINPGKRKKTKKRISAQGRAVATTIVGKNVDTLTSFPPEYRSITLESKKEVVRTGQGLSVPEVYCLENGTIQEGKGLRRADYPLVKLYNKEIARIVKDLGHALAGNPASLVSDLNQRIQAGRSNMANGIRAEMKRIIAVLQGPDRLNFTGVEVQIGKKRSVDYTMAVTTQGVITRFAVEVKNWTTVKDAEDLTDKGQRLITQLTAYINLAKSPGNNFDVIILEWIGFSKLDAKAQARFNGIINKRKAHATKKGVRLDFKPM